MELRELDERGRKELGLRIQRECSKQRLTQKELAYRSGYDEKTIRNVFKGDRTRSGTIENICLTLKIEPYIATTEKPRHSADLFAADEFGAYVKGHFSEYVGLYLVYRRSFTSPGYLFRFVSEIAWDLNSRCLTFRDLTNDTSPQNREFSHTGEIFISKTVGLLHFLTRYEGAVRLTTLTKLRLDDNTMRGTLLTQAEGEFYYQPSVTPIIYKKLNPALSLDVAAKQIGALVPGGPEYEKFSAALYDVEKKVMIFAPRSHAA